MSLKKLAMASLIFGVIVGCVILWIAFQENPQGEFFDYQTGIVQLGSTASLFLSAVVEIAFAVFALAYTLLFIIIFWRRRNAPQP